MLKVRAKLNKNLVMAKETDKNRKSLPAKVCFLFRVMLK